MDPQVIKSVSQPSVEISKTSTGKYSCTIKVYGDDETDAYARTKKLMDKFETDYKVDNA